MIKTHSLQELAFYMRDHFGKDSDASHRVVCSSFDIVLSVFGARGAALGDLELKARASTILSEQLRFRFSAPDVDRFVDMILRYLRCQYAGPADLEADKALLCLLFRVHVVEAGMARQSTRIAVAV
jgi:hypothetical protein